MTTTRTPKRQTAAKQTASPATTAGRLDLPDHAPAKRSGRQTVWTPDRIAQVWPAILTHIANGGSVDAFCARDGAPCRDTVYKWVRELPGYAEEYTRAREMQGDTYADRVADVAGKVERGELDANAGRTAIDALKWLAAKRKPKVYGDRIDVNATSNVNVSVGWVIDLAPTPGDQAIDVTPSVPLVEGSK